MKNIHVLQTDKQSRLYLTTKEYIFEKEYSLSTDECQNKHIYITSDEEIKKEDWVLNPIYKTVYKWIKNADIYFDRIDAKKIILTTDQDLIKDGVQAIDDEFLEWFIKNSSCKEFIYEEYMSGKYLAPKEEIKQETLEDGFCNNCNNDVCCCIIRTQETIEEAAERLFPINTGDESLDYQNKVRKLNWIAGAKWQQEQDKNKYSDEEVENILIEYVKTNPTKPYRVVSWFKQFKNK